MSEQDRVTQRTMDGADLVRHHYGRRVQWGTDAVLYRKNHPMLWSKVDGNYQNWEVDTSDLVPEDATSAEGAPTRLFQNEDFSVWLSRRRESMQSFWRNCDADELHLISTGTLRYETDFGSISVEPGDFLLIPKGVTYRVHLDQPGETLRVIYESAPEIFLVPTEMIEHIYQKGRPPLTTERLTYPKLAPAPTEGGPFEVKVKYHGAFSEWFGDMSTITYDFYPFDTEIVDGDCPVFKFNVKDIEKLGTTPVAFLGGRYFDNADNVAWTLHLSGGGSGTAPVHRNPDADELRYSANGEKMGSFLFTPQGVDHGGGRGYTKRDRNRPPGPWDQGASISAYVRRPLKGTEEAKSLAVPSNIG